ncbi:MAG TPA: hypothetical protein VEP49_12115 [Acidimicrobiia bacterium]|nr:hypothetical protein [Acidimicrobiia bacterium]
MRGRRGAAGVVAVLVAMLVAAPIGARAASRPLVPRPGTGHGVLGGPAPAEEAGSLSYSPGLGFKFCHQDPGKVSASGSAYGTPGIGRPTVGLPVDLCIGPFPTAAIKVSVAPPHGPVIAVPAWAVGREGTSATVQLLFLPGPPRARYVITGAGPTTGRPTADSGSLAGSGVGRYTVRVSGGGSTATTTFTLEPAPTPRLSNLGDRVVRVGVATTSAVVEPGRRLQFGAAGLPPLHTFEVGVYGPDQRTAAGPNTHPLATTITARADRQGEAIVTLDTLTAARVGSYLAVLDPKTSLAGLQVLDPRVAAFEVAQPTTTPPATSASLAH